MRSFGDYKDDAANWITLSEGEFYPDVLPIACDYYGPVLARFREMLQRSNSSSALFRSICDESAWMRIQLCRVFRKYVSPTISVEMLKKKSQMGKTLDLFAGTFRPIAEVQEGFTSRPHPDEALCALLWEYKSRATPGYDLTEKLFTLLEDQFSSDKFPTFTMIGPKRAGKDVAMEHIWPDFPKPKMPVDFVLKDGNRILAIGFVRYDSDRGGSQEADRLGVYRDAASAILGHRTTHGKGEIKIIYINDGPGLLLGSMWDRYAAIESIDPYRVRVATLRMVPERITAQWLWRGQN